MQPISPFQVTDTILYKNIQKIIVYYDQIPVTVIKAYSIYCSHNYKNHQVRVYFTLCLNTDNLSSDTRFYRKDKNLYINTMHYAYCQ